MFRVILRNIQFYLLLSSALLALLAFQHLNFYDQGILPYDSHASLLDKPSYGSPDEATRGVLYYGDEAKEIGIFKFKVGLFKFALPTFARDEFWGSESGDGRWKTVPAPPNRKRAVMRGRKVSVDKSVKEHEIEMDGNSRKSSVGYAVIIPFEDHSSFQERAAVLAASIKKAHVTSLHKYQLHAINFEHPSSSDTEKSFACNHSCREMLAQLGYKVVNVSRSDLDLQTKSKKQIKEKRIKNQSLNDLLGHNFVVHLSLDSFLLKPIDMLLDKLKDEQHDLISPNVDSSNKNGLLRKKTDTLTNSRARETITSDNQLCIFKPSSNKATAEYLKLLKCFATSYPSNKEVTLSKPSSIERRDTWQPTLYPKIRHLLSSALPKTKLKETEVLPDKDHCIINSNVVLDKCIYGGQNCPIETIEKNTIIASFNNECVKPWKCKRNDDGVCVGGEGGQIVDETCEWLQSEWFRLAKS